MHKIELKSFKEIEELIIKARNSNLSTDEKNAINVLENYYEELRKIILIRDFQNADKDILEVTQKYRWLSKKVGDMLTNLFTTKSAKKVIKGNTDIPNGPVIFLSLHRDKIDNFIGISEINGPAPILHGATVNEWLLNAQRITGVIPVVKGDKTSELNAKLDICKILLNGTSVFIYPESTHNLSPNKPWLPWSWGAIDIARIANVPIIPVVRDYEYSGKKHILGGLKISETYSMYGKPIYVGLNDSASEIAELIEKSWWDLIEEAMIEKSKKSPTNKDVTKEYKRFLLKHAYNGLKFAGLTPEYERSHIRGADEQRYQEYESYINDHPIDIEKNLVEPNILFPELCKESSEAFPNYIASGPKKTLKPRR